jgi:hypothetical protein
MPASVCRCVCRAFMRVLFCRLHDWLRSSPATPWRLACCSSCSGDDLLVRVAWRGSYSSTYGRNLRTPAFSCTAHRTCALPGLAGVAPGGEVGKCGARTSALRGVPGMFAWNAARASLGCLARGRRAAPSFYHALCLPLWDCSVPELTPHAHFTPTATDYRVRHLATADQAPARVAEGHTHRAKLAAFGRRWT